MWSKEKIKSITEIELNALVENQIPEGRTLEYKQMVLFTNREEKREFLADISSFANSQGGIIIIGVSENKGLPISIDGMEIIDVDKELLTIENLIRDNIEPRIIGIEFHTVKLSNDKVVLLISIPNSYVKPHVVNFSGHWRFYSRNSVGKYPLDLNEVKSAVISAESQAEKLQKFRLDRINKIISGDIPVNMNDKPKMVVHLIPAYTFDKNIKFDIYNYFAKNTPPSPISASGWNHKSNFDGIITFSDWADASGVVRTYMQLFKNGIIEAVDSTLLRERQENKKYIPSVAYEERIIKSVTKYLGILKNVEVPLPLFFTLSFHGINEYYLAVDESKFWSFDTQYIDRNDLIIPEVMIDEYHVNVAKVLKPVFDSVWNSAGWDKCMNYNDKGEWVGH